jgi:hypothetical protein
VEPRQIEHFLAVVEEGSFTRAATRVSMVQSSVSESLLALERELGTDLSIRGRRGAELTDVRSVSPSRPFRATSTWSRRSAGSGTSIRAWTCAWSPSAPGT